MPAGPVDKAEESAPKAGSQRTVHLPDQGVDALDEHLRVRGTTVPTDRLFARPNGSMLRAGGHDGRAEPLQRA
jgi:hypothetical protein